MPSGMRKTEEERRSVIVLALIDLVQSSSEDMSLMAVPGKLQSPYAPAWELVLSSLQAYRVTAAQVFNQGKHDMTPS